MTPANSFAVNAVKQSDLDRNPSAARYDVLIVPLVAALRDAVVQIGAEMVLVFVASQSFDSERQSTRFPVGDGDMLRLACSIEAPPARLKSQYHLVEAARLIEAASRRRLRFLTDRAQARIVLQVLRIGWWHLLRVEPCPDNLPLIDIRQSCCAPGAPGPRI